jgi:invasion protein IalB
VDRSSRGHRRPLSRVSGTAGLILAASLLASVPAAAQLRGRLPDGDAAAAPQPDFRIKPAEGASAEPGVRRVIQTFSGWTLICDEAKRTRVCNVSQTILAGDGSLVFSWSLAATSGGEPVFVLRAPVKDAATRTVAITVDATRSVIRLDPRLVRGIRGRATAAIRYGTAEGGPPVAFTTSLDGLKAAMASIR